jgi:hypothetical protein
MISNQVHIVRIFEYTTTMYITLLHQLIYNQFYDTYSRAQLFLVKMCLLSHCKIMQSLIKRIYQNVLKICKDDYYISYMKVSVNFSYFFQQMLMNASHLLQPVLRDTIVRTQRQDFVVILLLKSRTCTRSMPQTDTASTQPTYPLIKYIIFSLSPYL